MTHPLYDGDAIECPNCEGTGGTPVYRVQHDEAELDKMSTVKITATCHLCKGTGHIVLKKVHLTPDET
jgi:DnaJ-class molecular chaperone